MRKKIISLLLALCMLLGMMPAVTLPARAAGSGSSTDAFGITTQGDLTAAEKTAEAKNNPYGTENWFNLFPVSELYVAQGDSGGRSYRSYNYSGSMDVATSGQNIGSKYESNSDEGFRMMDTAACDALGEGQGRYVATVAYWENDDNDTIQLFLSDQNGNRVSNTVDVRDDNSFEFLDEVGAYQYNGFLSVACGDFDGDGKDSVVVYLPFMERDNVKPLIREYTISGGGGSFHLTESGNVIDNLWSILGTGDLSTRNSRDYKVRNNTPLVQLLAEDTDKDGVDELVMTTSISSCSADDVSQRGSRLFVYDKLKNSSWSQSAALALQVAGDASKKGRLRWASSTVGNLAQNSGGTVDFPEILSAGYYDYNEGASTAVSDDEKTNIAAYVATCTAVSVDADGNQIGAYAFGSKDMQIEGSKYFQGGLYTGDDVQSLLPTQAFAARGANYADYVLIGDTVYSYEGGKLNYIYRDSYFNDDDNGINSYLITNGLVQDAAAGNFDGNSAGVEQVVFTTMQKRSSHNDYFDKIYTYQLSGSSFSSEGKPIKNNWSCSSTGYQTYCKGYAWLSLTTFDCDSDSTIVKYKDVSRTYTDPEVLALLEATPYYSEVDGGDVGNSATSYGTSRSTGTSSTYSNSLSTNIVAGFEWSVDDIAAGFVCGVGFEATIEQNYTWSTTEEQYETYSLTYSNDTGDNMVIVYRRPVITYCYEEKGSGKLHTISKEGTLSTSMISVDQYNELAAQNGMDPISDSVLSTPGDPFSYRSTKPKDAVTKDENTQQYHGSGTIEQSFTTGTSTEKAFEYELNTSFTAYGLVFGVKAGGGAGYAHTEGSSTMNTAEVTKAGAVTGNTADGYDFKWQFAYWNTTVNGNTVPVMGYIITDPVAPPSPPQNLSASDMQTNSFTLNWNAGARPADEYRVYRVLKDTGAEPVQVAVVDGTATSCEIANLRADTTYTYVVKAYSAPGDGVNVYGLSVPSGELTVTTPPDGAEAPTITGPGDQQAKAGGTAAFRVSVELPAGYGSVSYRWQQRQGASNWSDASGAKTSVLTLTGVTEAMDGTEYRCVLTAAAGDGSPTYYYSGVGRLSVGRTSVTAGLRVANAGSGSGTLAEPYTGAADYQKFDHNETKAVTSDVPAVIAAEGERPALTVHRDGTGEVYVGVGAASDGSPVYYNVTKNSDGTYAAGDKLTLTQYQYTKLDGTVYGGMPVFPGPAPITSTIGGKTYTLAAVAAGATANAPIAVPEGSTVTPRDTRLTGLTGLTLYWFDGAGYYAHTDDTSVGEKVENVVNAFDVYLSADAGYVLGRSETYTTSVTETVRDAAGTETSVTSYEDTTKYWFTHAANSNGVWTAVCVSQAALGQLGNAAGSLVKNLAAVTAKQTADVVSPVFVTAPGTVLALTAAVTANEAAAPGAKVSFRILNTSTGSTENVPAAESNGTYTASWHAPAPGLYSIQTVVLPENGYAAAESAAQYYYAKDAAVSTEYRLLLSGGSVAGEMDYGSGVTLSTQSREQDASEWTNATNIVYTVTDPVGVTTTLTGAAFTPKMAGTFSFKAYDGAVSTDKLLAASALQVRRLAVTVKPTWTDGQVPAALSDIGKTVTAGALASGDSLDSVLDVVCELYGEDGKLIAGKSGRYPVSLVYKTDANSAEAVAAFRNCYTLNLQSGVLIVKPDSAGVYFEAGENGTVVGRYGDNQYTMASGRSCAQGTPLKFTASPAAGYQVKSWTVNGTALNANSLPAGYTLSGNSLSIASFNVTSDTGNNGDYGTSLLVRVDFASSSNQITFGADNAGGALTAVNNNGATPEPALLSGQSVALGATVTFTAAPETGKSVDHWTLDGKTYTWPGTGETYRGTTLKLENISASHRVLVSFADGTSYTVSAAVCGEDGLAQPTLATITARNTETGAAVSLGGGIAGGTSLTFTATLNSPSTNTVKEWQYLAASGAWVAAAGSGGQTSFTFYNLGSDLSVRAVITNAQSFGLTYKILLNGAVCTDASIASLAAASNGAAVAAGRQPAYIPVDFTLTLSDDYRVVEWSNNVTANAENNRTASIASLTADTAVAVTIAEKPKVTVQASDHGAVSASGTRMGKAVSVAGGGAGHVEKDSSVTVTAVPDTGWYVESVAVNGAAVFTADAGTYDPDAVTCTAAAAADLAVSVTCARKPVVTFSGDADVTVSASQGGKALTSGGFVEKYSDPIVFTAEPNTGYACGSWSVNGGSAFVLTAGADDDVTAYTFPAAGSTVTGDIAVSVASSEIPTYAVSYRVVDTGNVSDGGDGYNGTLTLASARKTLDAYDVAGETADSDTAPTETLYRGSTVTLTAAANEGYRVKGWLLDDEEYVKDGAPFKDSVLTLSALSEPHSVQVEFEKRTDRTTVAAGTGGRIVSAVVAGTPVDPAGFKLSNGAAVAVTAEASTGYEPAGWTVNGAVQPGETGAVFTYTSGSDSVGADIVALFRQAEYGLSYADGTGTISVTGYAEKPATARGGTALTLAAAPDPGYEFAGWTIRDEHGTVVASSDENSYVWTVPNGLAAEPVSKRYTIAASYSRGGYAVSYAVAGGSGAVSSTSGETGASVIGGTLVTFTAAPDVNWRVKSWTVDGVAQPGRETQLTLSITKATNVRVEFERGRYLVTFDEKAVRAVSGGTQLSSGAAVAAGADVTFTAVLSGTDIVKSWTANGVSDGGTDANPSEAGVYTLSGLSADTAVSVETMALPSYAVSFSAGTHGAVAYAADKAAKSPLTLKRHAAPAFVASPEAYYQVDQWTVNGTAVTAANAESLGVSLAAASDGSSTLTVLNLTAAANIAVRFKEAVRYNVKFSADTTNGSGTIAAKANGEAISYTGAGGIDVIGGSALTFTASPAMNSAVNAAMVYHWYVNGAEVADNLSNTLTMTLDRDTVVKVAFEAYVGYQIPVSKDGYVVSNVVRTPDDTLPSTEIRRGGTLTFTVSPDGTFDYAVLTKLTICGVDLLTGAGAVSGADSVAAVKNANGSYTVTVKGVRADIAASIEAQKIVVDSLKVPDALKEDESLNTPEKIQTRLDAQLTARADGQAHYDIELKYLKNGTWTTVTAADFPAAGVDVVLPYPAGTNKNDSFSLTHMLTTAAAGHAVGDVVAVSFTKEDDGLHFHTASLSPFAVGWTKYTAPSGGGGSSVTEYTVKFVTNCFLRTADLTVAAGKTAAQPALTRGSYTLDGWYVDAALTQAYDFSKAVEKDLTLYAKWTAGSKHLCAAFTDIRGHWAFPSICWTVENGLMNGTSATLYSPERSTSRAMIVTILWRMEGKPSPAGSASFGDVADGRWYTEAVRWAAEHEIVKGYGNGRFGPDDSITREQMAAILYRYSQYRGADTTQGGMAVREYPDYASISSYALSAMGWSVNAGLITGMADGSLNPRGYATRAQAATILARYCANLLK